MKTLIILKGLVKKDKLDWINDQKLGNFFLDYNILRKLYYKPEYYKQEEVLVRSKDNLVYEQYLRILCHRLDLGCMVVVDMDYESTLFLESLAVIYGYTVFYKTFKTPQDFVGANRKYRIPYYQTQEKSELREIMSGFTNKELGKLPNRIVNWSDVAKYWDKRKSKYEVEVTGNILHISDLHSNWGLYKQIRVGKKVDLTIFHGDYIDGPETGGSRKLIDLALYCPDQRIIFLEGNHEIRLRKYLGSSWLWSSKKTLAKILRESLPADFMNRTAPDFEDITRDPAEARQYLIDMNGRLQEFVKVTRRDDTLYCTHSGFRYLDQIDPRYIGNVIYGSRNMDKIDSSFSRRHGKKGLWSIHAHCQYPMVWNPFKYDKVINLDPEDENTIDYYINEPGGMGKDLYVVRGNELKG